MEVSETIEKPVKRTYQKHKTEKKISIVHFLNTKIKPAIFESELHYPLYIRITKDRMNTTIKSVIWGEFSIKDIETNQELIQIMELEKQILKLEMNNLSLEKIATFEDLLKNYSSSIKEHHRDIKLFLISLKKEVFHILWGDGSVFPFLKLLGMKKTYFKNTMEEPINSISNKILRDILFPVLINDLTEYIHSQKFNNAELIISFKKKIMEKINFEEYFKNVG